MLIMVETGLGTNSDSGSLARGRPLGNVLYLFSEFFELGLQFDDLMGHGGIIGLGTDCIGLPAHLLKQEIQASTHGLARIAAPDHIPELVHVTAKTNEFFPDVEAIGQDPLTRWLLLAMALRTGWSLVCWRRCPSVRMTMTNEALE